MKPFSFFIAFFCTLSVYGQDVIIGKNVKLPLDSIIRTQLISALNGFLAQKKNANSSNTYVLKEDLPETSALLDEMKDIEQNVMLKDDHFYSCRLINITQTSAAQWLVQLAYLGTIPGEPLLRASFRLVAKRQEGRIYFLAPLKQNTRNWHSKHLGSFTFYYRDTLASTAAHAYLTSLNSYNRKLNVPTTPGSIYYFDNFADVQQSLGMDYMLDYNGIRYDIITSHENNTSLMLNGWNDETNRFDPHDLWHDCLRTVMDAGIINRPVDEGCAYLYGGSWGINWPNVLERFKAYAIRNPNADWLTLYINDKKQVFNSDTGKPLCLGYAINALIVSKTEREKGFAAVMQLLGCGKVQQGDENYFAALDRAAGITKANFNAVVWKLVKER